LNQAKKCHTNELPTCELSLSWQQRSCNSSSVIGYRSVRVKSRRAKEAASPSQKCAK
jgi:hypothetical protein